jgi:transcription elongation GreA/GreB family factor
MFPHSMNPDAIKAVEAGKLSPAQAKALEQLPAGTYVLHKSWGFGQMAELNFELNQATIHFSSKRGHTMQLVYAAESLSPISAEHILTRIATDLPSVRSLAQKDPVEFTRIVLSSYGNRLSPDQFAQAVVPAVFKEADFKKWWESTKKLLKKDGHFSVPSKKNEPILLHEEAVSRAEKHLKAFLEARLPKDQINALDQILRDLEEFRDNLEILQPVLEAAEDSARKHAKLAPPESLTLLVIRDELLERSKKLQPLQSSPNAPSIAASLVEESKNLHTLLDQIPASKLKRALAAFPEAFGDEWLEKALSLVTRGSARLVAEAARLLQELNKTDALHSALERAIRDYSLSSAALTWLCDKKERNGQFRSLLHPRVFSAIMSALERDQFNENRDRKLHDLLINDQELVPDLIASASLEELREVMRKLLLTPVFEDLNKRSLLGRFVRAYPELEALISGEREERQESLIVSWDSLQKRQLEYEDIVQKKIPENTKEISIARSYGDLRENFEFKAAKEMQAVLMRRKAEMERDLAIARGTDFSNPDTSVVSVGTTVTLRWNDDGHEEIFHILGAWDTDPSQSIISYKAATAQALLGKPVGDSVELPDGTRTRSASIISIVAWNLKTADTLA